MDYQTWILIITSIFGSAIGTFIVGPWLVKLDIWYHRER